MVNPAPFLGATTPKGLGQVPYLVYGESAECARTHGNCCHIEAVLRRLKSIDILVREELLIDERSATSYILSICQIRADRLQVIFILYTSFSTRTICVVDIFSMGIILKLGISIKTSE